MDRVQNSSVRNLTDLVNLYADVRLQTSSDSESTSTLVDDTVSHSMVLPRPATAYTKQAPEIFFNELNNDSGFDLPGIPVSFVLPE